MLEFLMLLSVVATTQHDLQIQWTAPEGCPSGSQIDERIAGYLGASAIAKSQSAKASASVIVTVKDGKFRAHIDTRFDNVPGERTLDGDSCEAVASATALILAMMIDPEAVRGVIAAPVAAAPVRAPAPPPPPQAPPQVLPPRLPPAEVVHVLLLPSVLLGHGLVPNTAYGGSLAVVLRQGIWEAGVVASGWGEQRARLELDREAGGRFSRMAAGSRLWRTLGGPQFTGRLGAGIDLARTTARGFGVSDPASDSTWGASPVLSLGGQLRLSTHLALRVDAESAFPLSRPRFTLIDRGEVWRAPAASITVGCGVQLQF
jgi:hypothetical protein